jgi:transcriptional regulator with XRE-family HTH domain
MALLDDVRRIVEDCGRSRYEIAKATGIDQAQLSRLMSASGAMSIPRLEQLLDELGFEINVRRKRKGTK